MEKNQRIYLYLYLVILTLFLNCEVQCKVVNLRRINQTKDTQINIGGFFPIHLKDKLSGNCSKLEYLSLAEAMIFAIEQINKDTSILPGKTLGYDIRDTCLNTRYTMEYALEFVQSYQNFEVVTGDPLTCSPSEKLTTVSGIIGTGNSQSSLLVTNLLHLVDIPLISYAATSDELSNKQYFAFFRTVPPDRLQSRAMVDIVKHYDWTYVIVLGSDDSYGRKGIEEFTKTGVSQGICVAMEEYFPMQVREDKLQSIITRVKQIKNAQVIILYCTSSQAQSIVEEALRQGVTGRTWIASEGWGGSDKILKKKYLPVLKGAVGVVLNDVKVKTYKEYIMKLSPAQTAAPWWKEFWEDNYNCTLDPTLTAKTKCNMTQTISQEIFQKTFNDRLNAYVIDAVYAIAYALHNMSVCVPPGGLLQGGNCPVFRDGIPDTSDVLVYLRNTHFQGNTGTIDFDGNGDSKNAGYEIVNLQEDANGELLSQVVGKWHAPDRNSSFRLDIKEDLMQWNNEGNTKPSSVCSETCPPGTRQTLPIGCCWECIKCGQGWISTEWGSMNCTKCSDSQTTDSEHTQCIDIPIDFVKWSDPSAIVLAVLTSIGIIGALFVLSVFIKFRDTPVVKGSNKDLSYGLLVCIVLCYVSVFMYLHKPTVISCCLQRLIFYVCYTTSVAILFTKTNIMVKAFNARATRVRKDRNFLERNSHRLFVLCLGSVQVAIVGLWIFLDNPHPFYDYKQKHVIFLGCKPFEGIYGRILRYLAIAYLCLVSLLCTYFAYKARKLPENFNEAKYIAFTMYVTLITWVTFFPVQANVAGTYILIISCSTNILAASSILLCMFSHKIYIILIHPEKNTVQFVKATITQHTFRKTSASINESRRVTLTSTPTSTPPISRMRALSNPAPRHSRTPPRERRSESILNKFLGRTGSMHLDHSIEDKAETKVVSLAMSPLTHDDEQDSL